MNEQMRKALEAAKHFIVCDAEYSGTSTTSYSKVVEQIDDALKSEPTTAELVEELRKRDGVEVVEIPEKGVSRVIVWDNGSKEVCDVLSHNNFPAIILRIPHEDRVGDTK